MSIPKEATCVFSWEIFDVYQRQQQMFDWSFQTFERATRPDTVNIIALLDTWNIVVTEERQPWSLPFCGLVWWRCDEWESALQSAKRELLEETWLVSEDWSLFTTYNLQSKVLYQSSVYIARNCTKISEQDLDVWGEKIKLLELSWEEFLDFIAREDFRSSQFALDLLRSVYLWQEAQITKRIFW